MSTLAYGLLTTKKTDPTQSTGVNTYLTAVAALVPAEVLTAHAAILSFTTASIDPNNASSGAKITSPTVLGWSFWGLIVVAILLYVYPRFKTWDPRRDLLRMLIPPLAFVAWTMLQKTTAFDAVWPTLTTPARDAVALFAAIFLGIFATALAYKVPAPATSS